MYASSSYSNCPHLVLFSLKKVKAQVSSKKNSRREPSWQNDWLLIQKVQTVEH
jgi:hypothetical protein